MEKYIGGKIFREIIIDDRVTTDLSYCLYCRVTSMAQNGGIYDQIEYKIPLDCISGRFYKQCPACKRIYVLKDPIGNE